MVHNDSGRDSTENGTENNTTLKRRKLLRYLGAGGCALAVTSVPDDDEKDKNEDEDENENGGKAKGTEKDLNNADEARIEDAENPTADLDEDTANVVFTDQGFGKGRSSEFVVADRVELNTGGYLSIHDYSRFQFAEGEDPADYDVPEPDELERPVCESLVGITEFLEPGVYEELNVPVLQPDSPAIEHANDPALGNHDVEVGGLTKSQPLIAIPHENNTEPEDFDCPDDPEYDGADDVDGAFANGDKVLDTVPVSHDFAVVTRGPDSKEQKALAERQAELIRDGVLVPQPLADTDADADDD